MTCEIKSAYLAAEGLMDPLLNELEGVTSVHDQLILSTQPAKNAFWAQNVWRNPQFLNIKSINDAANQLKALQRNWCLYSYTCLLYTSPSPRDQRGSRMPSSA